jgi:hypothetical protein
MAGGPDWGGKGGSLRLHPEMAPIVARRATKTRMTLRASRRFAMLTPFLCEGLRRRKTPLALKPCLQNPRFAMRQWDRNRSIRLASPKVSRPSDSSGRGERRTRAFSLWRPCASQGPPPRARGHETDHHVPTESFKAERRWSSECYGHYQGLGVPCQLRALMEEGQNHGRAPGSDQSKSA